MFDFSIIFILQNIFLLMFLFWFLSWVGDKFYKTKHYLAMNETYECGFLSTHSLKIQLNLPFILMAWLLILYDIEFFFLIPFFLNLGAVNALSILIFWAFWVTIVMSFIIDWFSPAIKFIM